MTEAKKTVRLLIWVTMILAVVYIVRNIIASFVYFTSFPWWSAFVFAAYYFIPALAIEGILYLALVFIEKYKK